MAAGAENTQGRSLAIWLPMKPTGAGKASVELHFNLWRLGNLGQKGKNKGSRDLLDVGIMIASPADVDSVSFYLPACIEIDDITDLGPGFSNAPLATGIFNEHLTATNGSPASPVVLKKFNGHTYCCVLCLPTSNKKISSSYINVRRDFDGTIITINSAALSLGIKDNPEDNLYIRLRIAIPTEHGSTFINAATPDDSWLTSSFDATEYLDFRLNQARNLNSGIAREIEVKGSGALVPIKRLDFLLVVGVVVDVVEGNPKFHKCRLLEPDLWKSYVDDIHLRKGMVIYHWKDEGKGDRIVDFNAFVKLRVKLSGKRIIFRYLIIAAVFGGFVGVVGNTLYDGLKSIVGYISGSVEPDNNPGKAAQGGKIGGNSVNGSARDPADNGEGPDWKGVR